MPCVRLGDVLLDALAALQLIDELQSFSADVVCEPRVDDALDPGGLDVACRLRLEIEDGLSGAHHGVGLRVMHEGVDDRTRLGEGGFDGAADATLAELAKDLARLHALFDQGVLVRVQEVSDETGVLVHDIRPETGDLAAVVLRLTFCERFKAAGPALGFVARVVEEQWPNEAAQLAFSLRLAQPCLVLDEGLHRLDNFSNESPDVAALRWP
jgi:hypothetical protein